VGDGLLQGVRVGQNTLRTARLVLDLEGVDITAVLTSLNEKVGTDDPYIKGVRIGRFKPAKRPRVLHAAGLERQDHLGEIQAFHFGKFLSGASRLLMLGPQAQAVPGGRASGSTGALVRGGAADLFDQQGVDAAIGIVTRNPRESAIDHQAHAVDGEHASRTGKRPQFLQRAQEVKNAIPQKRLERIDFLRRQGILPPEAKKALDQAKPLEEKGRELLRWLR